MNSHRPAADPEHELKSERPAADVANIGLARPPFVYMASIVAGLLAHVFWPVPWLPDSVNDLIGITVMLVAAWVNSVGVLIAVLPALAVIVLVVIPREERYLETRFPADYLPYKREVRRWL